MQTKPMQFRICFLQLVFSGLLNIATYVLNYCGRTTHTMPMFYTALESYEPHNCVKLNDIDVTVVIIELSERKERNLNISKHLFNATMGQLIRLVAGNSTINSPLCIGFHRAQETAPNRRNFLQRKSAGNSTKSSELKLAGWLADLAMMMMMTTWTRQGQWQ